MIKALDPYPQKMGAGFLHLICPTGSSTTISTSIAIPQFRLVSTPRTTLRDCLRRASDNNVLIRALFWDRVIKSGSTHQNDGPRDFINSLRTGHAILDGRVINSVIGDTYDKGSHHQKLLLVNGPEGLLAFAGGVDFHPNSRLPARRSARRGPPVLRLARQATRRQERGPPGCSRANPRPGCLRPSRCVPPTLRRPPDGGEPRDLRAVWRPPSHFRVAASPWRVLHDIRRQANQRRHERLADPEDVAVTGRPPDGAALPSEQTSSQIKQDGGGRLAAGSSRILFAHTRPPVWAGATVFFRNFVRPQSSFKLRENRQWFGDRRSPRLIRDVVNAHGA